MSWWDFGESDFEKQTRISLEKIYKGVLAMSQALDSLKAQVTTLVTNVAAIEDVVEAATAAFTGLTEKQAELMAKLQEAIDANDPAAIQAAADSLAGLNDEIIAQKDKLSAAIPANTPAE